MRPDLVPDIQGINLSNEENHETSPSIRGSGADFSRGSEAYYLYEFWSVVFFQELIIT
jgi:hypothetical protein